MTSDTLIVAPSWIGDMVMTHSLVRLLRRKTDTSIHLLAPRSTASLGLRMPGVSQTHVLDIPHGALGLYRRWQWARRHDQLFGQAILIPNSFKSAITPWLSGVPLRTGWKGEYRFGLINDIRKRDVIEHPLMAQQIAALGLDPGESLKDFPLPQLVFDRGNFLKLAVKFGLSSTEKKLPAISPGADFGGAKRWPISYFVQVGRAIVENGGAIWLIGSDRDQSAGALISEGIDGEVIDLCGKTSLLDAIDLLSQVDQVICNDSGLMHVASALEKKVIAIFGSTSPAFTPPLTKKGDVVQQKLSCSPCFERECPLGHTKCLYDLEPKKVIELL